MRLSKRHLFTFSVLSLLQFTSGTLNAGQILKVIEKGEVGDSVDVRATISCKLNMQKLRQAQVERWIEGIKSLSHTQQNLKVGEQSLTDALNDLESLKDYLAQKVKFGKKEIEEIDDWSTSQGGKVAASALKSKYIELREKRGKYTRASANTIQVQSTKWALLVKPENFNPLLEAMIAPLRGALNLVGTYEDTLYGERFDNLFSKNENSKKPGAETLTGDEKNELRHLKILFNEGSTDQMIVRINQAYSSKELFEYLTNKAARYAVKSILSPVTLPDPAVPNTPAGPTNAAHVDETQSEADVFGPNAHVGDAANSDVVANVAASAGGTSSLVIAPNQSKRKKK